MKLPLFENSFCKLGVERGINPFTLRPVTQVSNTFPFIIHGTFISFIDWRGE
jgi:hypothetical protein